MNVIVAVDENWGIGKDNKLLASIPEDMQFFRETTLHSIVIMGRNTFESLPGKRPLPLRVNIVISKNKELEKNGVIVCPSIEDALKYIKENYGLEKMKDVFFIGGESIYKKCLKYCDTAYVTKIHSAFQADRHFPNIDGMSDWELVQYKKEVSKNGTIFTFKKYISNKNLVDIMPD